MFIGIAFWLLMIIWAVFGYMGRGPNPDPRIGFGGDVLEFVLFALLGWAAFGAVLHG